MNAWLAVTGPPQVRTNGHGPASQGSENYAPANTERVRIH